MNDLVIGGPHRFNCDCGICTWNRDLGQRFSKNLVKLLEEARARRIKQEELLGKLPADVFYAGPFPPGFEED